MKPVTVVLEDTDLAYGIILPDFFFLSLINLNFCSEFLRECAVIDIMQMKVVDTKHHRVGLIINTSVAFAGSHEQISVSCCDTL
jgi:hypothetical protein